jgi:iron complex outermembrane recepter protein
VQNLFDERGILSKNTVCSVTYCGPYAASYPVKPLLFGVKFGQKF